MSTNTQAHANIIAIIVSQQADFNDIGYEVLASNASFSTKKTEDGSMEVLNINEDCIVNICVKSRGTTMTFAAALGYSVDTSNGYNGDIDIADAAPHFYLTSNALSDYPSVMRCDDELKLQLFSETFNFNIVEGVIPMALILKQAIVKQINTLLKEGIEKQSGSSYVAIKKIMVDSTKNTSIAVSKLFNSQ